MQGPSKENMQHCFLWKQPLQVFKIFGLRAKLDLKSLEDGFQNWGFSATVQVNEDHAGGCFCFLEGLSYK